MLRPALAFPAFALAMLLASTAAADPVRSRIYPAPTAALSTAGLPAGTTLIDVATADGLRLKGIELPGRADRPVVLLFHGNGSSAADALH